MIAARAAKGDQDSGRWSVAPRAKAEQVPLTTSMGGVPKERRSQESSGAASGAPRTTTAGEHCFITSTDRSRSSSTTTPSSNGRRAARATPAWRVGPSSAEGRQRRARSGSSTRPRTTAARSALPCPDLTAGRTTTHRGAVGRGRRQAVRTGRPLEDHRDALQVATGGRRGLNCASIG